MPLLSRVLLIESRIDPEIERTLGSLGVHVHIATETRQALELSRDLLPAIILIDARYPEADCWRLIAEIWENAKKRTPPPALILLADDAASWNVDRFGPLRFSDRQHLRQAFRDILDAPAATPDVEWELVRESMLEKGNARYRGEVDRLRRLGIVEEGGRATSKDVPDDMRPASRTDVAT